jgi:hypothetical protein
MTITAAPTHRMGSKHLLPQKTGLAEPESSIHTMAPFSTCWPRRCFQLAPLAAAGEAVHVLAVLLPIWVLPGQGGVALKHLCTCVDQIINIAKPRYIEKNCVRCCANRQEVPMRIDDASCISMGKMAVIHRITT